MKPSFDQELALALFRFMVGLNFFMHGAVRIFGDLGKFVSGIQTQFKDTILPDASITLFATTLPFVEFILGGMLILGLLTRWALVGGFLTMASLMFGMSLLQKWDVVGSHMVYAACFFLLLYFNAPNRFSVDGLVSRGKG